MVKKYASKVDAKKGPFKCPFVLKLYPIDTGLMGAKKRYSA